MAKVNASFDTIEKTLEVTVDGKKLDNCMSISMGIGYEGEAEMNIMCKSEDESSDMTTYTHIAASKEEAELILKNKAGIDNNGVVLVKDKAESIKKAAYQLFSMTYTK